MVHMPSLGMWLVIGVLGVIFFGKRLPEVGRSLGKGIVEFKKGLKSVENDIELAVDEPTERGRGALPEHKFDPFTGKPIANPNFKFDPYTGKPVNAEVSASDSTAHVPPAST